MSNRNALLPCLLSAILIFFGACKKTDAPSSNTVIANTDSLSQDVYTITRTSLPSTGTILAAPFLTLSPDSGQLLIMDDTGRVLQKKKLPGAGLDFTRWTIDGNTRYSYFVNDLSAYHIPILANIAGYLVITDSLLNEINRIDLMSYEDGAVGNHTLDVHDFIYLSDNHYIVEYYDDKHTTNIPSYLNPNPKNKIVAPVIQEVQNGSVIWEWDGSTDTSFYNNSMFANNYADTLEAQDYMHLNSMTLDPRDNNLIVSFRSQSQVIKLDRNSGAVLWRLGGKNSDFPLTADQVFLFEHDVTLTDNNSTLLMFDNGDQTIRPQSRVLEFQLDEVNKTVTSFSAFDIPEPFSPVMGSVQKFGDIYFIGGGSGNYILEVNHVTNEKIIEFKSNQATYRAYKLQ